MDALDVILVMGSIHRVLKAEALLKGHSIPVDTRVTPREVSADCGMVVMVCAADVGRVMAVLEKAGVEPASVWRMEGGMYRRREESIRP